MKRIVGGKTYNTETAALVARGWWTDNSRWRQDAVRMQDDLYITRGGAFFRVRTEVDNAEARAILEPLTRARAEEWAAEDEVEIYDATALAEPPEAAAEVEPEATLYIRVPRALKERIEGHAKEDGVSLNAWVMRCVERCAAEQVEPAEAAGRNRISGDRRRLPGHAKPISPHVAKLIAETVAKTAFKT